MNPFDYTPRIENENVNLTSEKDGYKVYSVRFSSAIDTGYNRNSKVLGDFYVPDSTQPAPMIILTHGMGDLSRFPCTLMAKSLVKHGIACFVPYLTIHSKRLPNELKPSMPYLSPEEWFNVYKVSVVDIQQILDWASTRKEIDSGRLFVSGISFGGFVSTIVMGLDKRVKAGIFIVTGGNSNKLSWENKEGQYRKRYKRTESEHLSILHEYSQYLDQVEKYGFENVPAKHISFLTDPMTFSSYLRDRPVFMINAKKDKYIPVENVKEFWEAINRPDIKWIPAGHVTIWFWYAAIRNSILGFLDMFTKPSSL